LPQDEAHIFDPFFTRKPDGTGLGLSISRQILEKHGAFIEATSTPSAGTIFHVCFPLQSPGTHRAGAPHPHTSPSTTPSA
jgi:signal transduction histidine kinase